MKNQILAMMAPMLLLSLGSSDAIAEDTLIVAHPKQIEFVMAEGDLPENQNSGKIYVGGVYKATIGIQHVLQGVLSQKEITVNLVATSRENLTKAKSILVLLSPDNSGGYRVVGWDELRYIACLPKTVALKRGLAETLPIELTTSNERCTYVK
jgi:hypothetical protein